MEEVIENKKQIWKIILAESIKAFFYTIPISLAKGIKELMPLFIFIMYFRQMNSYISFSTQLIISYIGIGSFINFYRVFDSIYQKVFK